VGGAGSCVFVYVDEEETRSPKGLPYDLVAVDPTPMLRAPLSQGPILDDSRTTDAIVGWPRRSEFVDVRDRAAKPATRPWKASKERKIVHPSPDTRRDDPADKLTRKRPRDQGVPVPDFQNRSAAKDDLRRGDEGFGSGPAILKARTDSYDAAAPRHRDEARRRRPKPWPTFNGPRR